MAEPENSIEPIDEEALKELNEKKRLTSKSALLSDAKSTVSPHQEKTRN